MLESTLDLPLSWTCLFKNNTYEINNGYLFDDIKAGNNYQIIDHMSNRAVIDTIQEEAFGYVFIVLDSKSNHIESSTNSIFDIIGTIGGSFELIHYVIFTMYFSLRNNLYLHTMINRVNSYKSSQKEPDIKMHNNWDKRSRTNNQINGRLIASRRFDKQDDSRYQMVLNHQFNKHNMRDLRVFGKIKEYIDFRQMFRK